MTPTADPTTAAPTVDHLPRGMSETSDLVDEQNVRSLGSLHAWAVSPRFFATPQQFVSLSTLTNLIRESLSSQFSRIDDLLRWGERWADEAALPQADTVKYAKDWLVKMFVVSVDVNRPLTVPNITLSQEGEIVFEWWHGSRKLTIYISDKSAEYVTAWGPNIATEMEEGSADDFLECRRLWLWLTSL